MIRMLSNKKENKTLCLAPWVSIHNWPDGKTFPCCLWDSNDPIGNVNASSLKELWNSDKMKEARVKMLKGEEVKSCSRCYHLESIGDGSYRERINHRYKDKLHLTEKTNTDGSLDDMELYLWDVRLSNFCNFKCRSCGAELSSSWHSDTIDLGASLEQYPKALINVNDRGSFMTMLEPHYSYVQEIYFAGGEPLIMPEHYLILDKLLSINRTDVTIRYSTNFSKLKFGKNHIFDYWKKFKNLELYISVDGIGKVGEYVRKGYNDKEFDQNIKSLIASGIKPKESGFIVTYGVLNFLHLFDMVIEFIHRGYLDIGLPKSDRRSIIFNPIDTPFHYDSRFLPDRFKKEFKEKLDNFPIVLKSLNCSDFFISDITNKLNSIYIRSVSSEFNLQAMEACVSITNKLDKLRKENLENCIPSIGPVENLLKN